MQKGKNTVTATGRGEGQWWHRVQQELCFCIFFFMGQIKPLTQMQNKNL